jgi:hypothetical protein
MPTPLAPADADRLRESLADLGYTPQGIAEALGTADLLSLGGEVLARFRYETREPSPLNLLLRLLTLGDDVPADDCRGALPGSLIAALLECGAIAEADGLFTPVLSIRPLGDLLIAFDPRQRLFSGSFVPGVTPAAGALMRCTVRRPVGRTLDLGTGCGLHALAAAVHSDRIVATDINPRALEMTEFNARLNGIENVEVCPGSLFEPVGDEPFDLIVTNPPFAITPGGDQTFYGSEDDLDSLCERIVREAHEYLVPGGLLQMVLDWVEFDGEDWRDRLRTWVEGTGCDAWVVPTAALPPAQYVSIRRREGRFDPEPEEEAEAGHERWRRYFEERGVNRIHGGFLMLRRTARDNGRVLFEETTAPPSEPWGDSVVATFEAIDFLRRHDTDEALLPSRLRLAEDLVVTRQLRRADRTWEPAGMQIAQTSGIGRRINTEPVILAAISRLTGEHTVAEAIDATAAEIEAPIDAVRSELLRVFRRLLETGFLVVPLTAR